MSKRLGHFAFTTTTTAVAAVAAALGTDVKSRWYETLEKPDWQPPGSYFAPVWTTLYALTAVSGGLALSRIEDKDERKAYRREFVANLALNTSWSWLFFTGKQPAAALVDSALLEVSTLRLMKKSAKASRLAAAGLTPYAAWVAFATALNGAIVAKNRA